MYVRGMGRARYGQFCPVAKAAEIVAERWTPLVIRELICGSTRFNEIRRGIPLMSPSLLSSRLRDLERVGVIVRRSSGRDVTYELTESGRELEEFVEVLGNWGKRWTGSEYLDAELDPGILMLDMRRNVAFDAVPDERLTIEFELDGPSDRRSRYWLVLADRDADVCLDDPGYEPDVRVEAKLRDFIGAWMGDIPLDRAIRSRLIRLTGRREYCRQFPSWFRRSAFAAIPRGVANTV